MGNKHNSCSNIYTYNHAVIEPKIIAKGSHHHVSQYPR